MASMQEQAVAVLSDKNKAILDGLKKEFANSISQSTQATTLGVINNNANGSGITLTFQHNWSGSLTKPYPSTILSGQNGTFVQQGPLPLGSKGAVAYIDAFQRKWLVAYYTPNNKVYVEVNRSTTEPDWTVVEGKLNSSTNSSVANDPDFGGVAMATITPDGQLGVTFSN